MSLVEIAEELRDAVSSLEFDDPVTHVYNALEYAWPMHRAYLERFGAAPKEAVFVGMNPGPWGMAQTGVPFGEIAAVRDWMGLSGLIGRPDAEHPKRPVLGLECPRSEVSGRRVWEWARGAFGAPDAFFARFFVANYCPLLFLEASGRNRTPDKLPAGERKPLEQACDHALRRTVEALETPLVVGVGAFAARRAERALDGLGVRIGQILHPSPASPAANRGWAPQVNAQLKALDVEI